MPKHNKPSRKRILDVAHYNLTTHDQEDFLDLRSNTLRKIETLDYLNGTHMPAKFKFRDEEMTKIRHFLESCINKQKKGYRFMMLTGSPGAGKTLCVNSVLSNMKCRIIRMNANIVKSIA